MPFFDGVIRVQKTRATLAWVPWVPGNPSILGEKTGNHLIMYFKEGNVQKIVYVIDFFSASIPLNLHHNKFVC